MSDWESFGPPALKVGPLEVWVHGREFPEADDAWDGNWLRVSARCSVHGAAVHASGSILDTVSFVRYANELRDLHKTLAGEAGLHSLEPELNVTLRGRGPNGILQLRIELSPGDPNQTHAFDVELDHSCIPRILEDCERVIAAYPVRRPALRGL